MEQTCDKGRGPTVDYQRPEGKQRNADTYIVVYVVADETQSLPGLNERWGGIGYNQHRHRG